MIKFKTKKVFILILTFFSSIVCYTNTNEEMLKKSTSSFVFFQSSDSLTQKKYNKIFNLYKKGDYIKALKHGLPFSEEMISGDNLELRYKSLLLVADIYDRTNNYNKSLKYYKLSLRVLNSSSLSIEYNSVFSKNYYSKTFLRIGSSFQKQQKK